MMAAMGWLDDVVGRALASGHLGPALTLVARTRMPILRPDRFALRTPEHGAVADPCSPLIEAHDPGPIVPGGVLEGDVVIKDQIDVAGLPTRVGLPEGPIAERDATLVTRIRAAGGRVIGKAKMTELGIDGLGTLMSYPMPPNPRAPSYVPGGSSTGTAVAVASGLARYGVGGDGLGSIRIPAAFCGLVGLKPGRERIPRDGIRSPVRTLDAVGPIARTAQDCARLWQVLSGESVTPLAPLRPTHVGVPIVGGSLRVARSVWLAFRRALDAIGTEIEPVRLAGFENVTFLGGMTGSHEMATGPYAGTTRTAAGRRSLALGRAIGKRDYERLQAQRAALREATARVLDRTPILAMPTTAIPPPALSKALLAGRSELSMLRALGAFTPLANLCDLPSIAVPCGVDDRGRPLSIMFVAGDGGETTLLRIAAAIEQTGLGEQPIAA
jgi:aspartyl-tRNA(Asn)/glutamyl-tRNA(Gln) amidotransferase subunit A